VELYKANPPVEEIFNGNGYEIPLTEESLVVLRSSMVAYARKYPTKTFIDNSVDYACKLPWTFRRKLLHDYYYMPKIRPIIAENEVFKTALKENEK
jgi:hypothetical protein